MFSGDKRGGRWSSGRKQRIARGRWKSFAGLGGGKLRVKRIGSSFPLEHEGRSEGGEQRKRKKKPKRNSRLATAVLGERHASSTS